MAYTEVYWAVRQARMQFANNKCETCKREDGLECHHASDEAYVKDENGTLEMTDLVILCGECHHAVTNVIRRRRYDRRLTFTEVSNGGSEFHCTFNREQPVGAAQQSMCGPAASIEEKDGSDHGPQGEEDGSRLGRVGAARVLGRTLHGRPAWASDASEQPATDVD